MKSDFHLSFPSLLILHVPLSILHLSDWISFELLINIVMLLENVIVRIVIGFDVARSAKLIFQRPISDVIAHWKDWWSKCSNSCFPCLIMLSSPCLVLSIYFSFVNFTWMFLDFFFFQFLQNQGFLVSVSHENEIQVWLPGGWNIMLWIAAFINCIVYPETYCLSFCLAFLLSLVYIPFIFRMLTTFISFFFKEKRYYD